MDNHAIDSFYRDLIYCITLWLVILTLCCTAYEISDRTAPLRTYTTTIAK